MLRRIKIASLLIFIVSTIPLNIISKPTPCKEGRRALATLFLSFGGIMYGATASTCALAGYLFDNHSLNTCAVGFGTVSIAHFLAAIANQKEIITV